MSLQELNKIRQYCLFYKINFKSSEELKDQFIIDIYFKKQVFTTSIYTRAYDFIKEIIGKDPAQIF